MTYEDEVQEGEKGGMKHYVVKQRRIARDALYCTYEYCTAIRCKDHLVRKVDE
jgi:hypothetical protein